ncbi:MAG: HAD hydrolase-like protein, partial [Desulfobacteraceae bacterium]|nr:HAD hydrolase-like protein [Desulfobacteraceae bacterium]
TIVEAVRTATGVDPLVIGKPHQPILEMALAPLGLRKAEVVFIGDNPYTDISAGINGGLATVLILTGVMTKSEFPEGIQPDWVVADYDELSALEIFNSR